MHETVEEILAESNKDKDITTPEYHELEDEDDADKTWNEGTILSQEDDANLNEQLNAISDDSMEDYEFDRISDYMSG